MSAVRISQAERDAAIRRWIGSDAWTEARAGGWRLALLWRLQGDLRALTDHERLRLRQRMAQHYREKAAAIEAGDRALVAIHEGWEHAVQEAERDAGTE